MRFYSDRNAFGVPADYLAFQALSFAEKLEILKGLGIVFGRCAVHSGTPVLWTDTDKNEVHFGIFYRRYSTEARIIYDTGTYTVVKAITAVGDIIPCWPGTLAARQDLRSLSQQYKRILRTQLIRGNTWDWWG